MYKNAKAHWINGKNVVFSLLEGNIEEKLLNWDGSEIETFADSLSTEDFEEMEAWSENHAFGSVNVDAAFPNVKDDSFTTEVKVYIIKKFINDCFMMVVQGQASFEVIKQSELVTHFYNLWVAVNGGC